jgi:hypothetical protein
MRCSPLPGRCGRCWPRDRSRTWGRDHWCGAGLCGRRLHPEQRTKSLGWLSAVTSLGAVVGPAFGSLMVALGGQKLPGLAAAALSVLVAALRGATCGSRARCGCRKAHHAPSTTTGRAAIAQVLSHWHEPAPRLIWIYAVAIGAFYGTIQTVPLLLKARLGINRAERGLLRHVPGRNGGHHPGPDPGSGGRLAGRGASVPRGPGAAGWRTGPHGLAHGLPCYCSGLP